MAGTITVELRGEVALLTLCNAAKRNALDPPMLAAIADALARLPGEGARAAVITGEGERAFSSGFDIAALSDAAGGDPLAAALDAVAGGALPVIAALNGLAVGGGCELAATCDLRVAHAGVTLAMPPVRLGIVYSPRGLLRFVSLIGASRTRELFLTAAPVDAARALAWGLVDHVVAPEEVVPKALALAGEIARGAPLAVRGTRAILERLLAPAADAELDELVRRAWTSDDAREARAAFREKRPPRFTGR
jgi:enoyl-CoA hydratase/carnithine racemase